MKPGSLGSRAPPCRGFDPPFGFTKDMTVCLDCYKVSSGLKDKCPACDSDDVEHISRITGYLQAVSGWNSAKRQELKDRKRYNDLA